MDALNSFLPALGGDLVEIAVAWKAALLFRPHFVAVAKHERKHVMPSPQSRGWKLASRSLVISDLQVTHFVVSTRTS